MFNFRNVLLVSRAHRKHMILFRAGIMLCFIMQNLAEIGQLAANLYYIHGTVEY